jgi:hypothetical protein
LLYDEDAPVVQRLGEKYRSCKPAGDERLQLEGEITRQGAIDRTGRVGAAAGKRESDEGERKIPA